jgi:endonuclease/exonuclease/phosphatase family metal-dependent hydrolase
LSRIRTALAAAFVGLCVLAPGVAQAANAEPTVMTRNLYLGASLTPIAVAAATGGDVGQAALAAFQNAVGADGTHPRNNFQVRAPAIAAEIGATHPDLVGLQEVSKFIVNGSTFLDYEPALLGALSAQGLHYAVVREQPETDISAPVSGLGVAELQLSNIILKRTDRPDLVVTNAQGASFQNQATFLGQSINRNWESADVTLGPKDFKFLNTHLESENDAMSTLQAKELIAGPLRSTKPVIAVGDYNSGPVSKEQGAYNVLTAQNQGKMRDAANAGLTCCRGELLSDLTNGLEERIDFVFTNPASVKTLSAQRVGVDPFATPFGFSEFPSDHTGVVATLRVP